MARTLCPKCGVLLDRFLLDQGEQYHIGCKREVVPVAPVQFGNPGGIDPFTESIRRDLMEVIRWADDNAARSQQKEIGPSELGNECDRFIAYRLAEIPEVNTLTDPWPAIVGTAIHSWLEKAFNEFQAFAGAKRWSTETTTQVDALTKGHLDLFDHWLRMVMDWKSLGTTKMKMWIKSGPPEKHKDQVNLYAMGQIAAGYKVEKVCLIGVPRAGWLDDMIVWTDDYRPERALAALARRDAIGMQLIERDVLNNPQRFEDFPALSDNCSFCPYFRVTNRNDGRTADDTGCPGIPRG